MLSISFESALVCHLYARIFNKICVVRFAGGDFQMLHSSLIAKELNFRGISRLQVFLFQLSFKIVKKKLPFIVLNGEMMRGLLKLGVETSQIHLIYRYHC